MKKIVTIILFVILSTALCAGSADTKLLFDEANTLFQEANDAALKDSLKSQKLYQNAALKYQYLICMNNRLTPVLLMNLGNAYYLSGDKGRALLNYYRATLIDPLDCDIQHNLNFVRSECVDEIEYSFFDKIMEKIFFFHYFSFRTRIILFGVIYSLMWLTLGTLLFKKIKHIKVTAFTLLAISLVMGFSIAITNMQLFSRIDGVITANETQAYQGDAYIYNAAFMTPLHSGTEFKLQEKRGDWYHISLADGNSCWIPSQDAELLKDF